MSDDGPTRWRTFFVTQHHQSQDPQDRAALELLVSVIKVNAHQLFTDGVLRYFILGIEKGKKSGRLHAHCSGSLQTPRGQEWYKRHLFHNDTHIEKARSAYSSAMYCKKEDTEPWILGELPTPTYREERGLRSAQVSELRMLVKRELEKDPFMDLKDRADWFYQWATTHFTAYNALRTEYKATPPPRQKRHVVVIWGPTGTGKTYAAESACLAAGASPIYKVTFRRGDMFSFEQYRGQSHVVFDEFDPEDLPINQFKILTNENPGVIRILHGSFIPRWTHIYITSNSDPGTWWQNALPADRQACLGRIKKVLHWTKKYVPPAGAPEEAVDFGLPDRAE